jgi:hypothetical protein
MHAFSTLGLSTLAPSHPFGDATLLLGAAG